MGTNLLSSNFNAGNVQDHVWGYRELCGGWSGRRLALGECMQREEENVGGEKCCY